MSRPRCGSRRTGRIDAPRHDRRRALHRADELPRPSLRRRPRRSGAARRAAAAEDARRGDRPAASARSGQAAARRLRVGPAALDDPVGPARHRQDDAGAADGRRLRRPVHRHVGGARRRQGHPRGGRSGAGGAHDRARDGRLRRRGASLQQEPAGRLPAARRVGPVHLHRRDHREPVVRGQLGAAVACHRACAASRSTTTDLRTLLERAAGAARGAAAGRRGGDAADRLCRRRRAPAAQCLREPGRDGRAGRACA